MTETDEPKSLKTKITAEHFLRLYFASDDEFEILKQGGQVPDAVERLSSSEVIDRYDLQTAHLYSLERLTLFNNVEVTEEIEIEDKESADASLIFFESKMYALTISDSNLTSSQLVGVGNINFVKSSIQHFNCINSVIGALWAYDHCTIAHIYIIDTVILEDITLDINCKINTIRLENNCEIRQIEMFRDSTVGFWRIVHCRFAGIRIIESSTGNLNIKKGSIAGNIAFIDSKIGQITAEDLNCSLFISSSSIAVVELTNCSIFEFKMILACRLEAYISNSQINLLNFSKATLNKETILSFSNSSFYVIRLEEFSVLGSLYFRRIKKAEKVFEWYDVQTDDKRQNDNVDEHDAAKLAKTYLKPTIYISQSSLGKTEFTDCPLGEFAFNYNNSKITDCFIMGGTVPEKNIEIIGAKPGSAQEHEQKALIYNQFKKIFEAQGDLYRASQFQSKWADHEMKYLLRKRKEERKLLKESGKERKFFFSENSQDILTLWLNGFSNKHGESWLKALGLLLVSAFLFYVGYLWSIGRCFNSHGFDPNLIGYYFEYLNPLHKSNFINDHVAVPGLSVAIDFVGRLLIAYFIYQFVAAFRKHGKKQ